MAAVVLPALSVQFNMLLVIVNPPVAAVNPTYAVPDPTTDGILIGRDLVNDCEVTVSVSTSVSVVPSYAICACMTFPLFSLTPEAVMSTAGTVGDAPFV